MDRDKKTIVDILLEQNRLTPTEAANFDKSATSFQIEQKLRHDKMVTSEDISKAYTILYDLPLIRLENYNVKPEAFKLISRELIEKYNIIAFEKEENKIKLAVGSPGEMTAHPEIINQIKEKKGVSVDIYITTLEDITSVLNRFKDDTHPDEPVKVEHIARAKIINLPTVDLRTLQISYDVISKFPIEVCRRYKVVVFNSPTPSLIQVAVSDPYDPKVEEILDFVRQKNEIAIQTYVATPNDISWAIETFYRKPTAAFQSPELAIAPPPVQTLPADGSNTAQLSPNPPANIPSFETLANQPKPESQLAPTETISTNTIQTLSTEPQKPPTTLKNQPPVEHLKEPKSNFLRRPEVNQKPEQVPSTVVPQGNMAQGFNEKDLDKFLGQQITDVQQLKEVAQTGNVPQILAALIALAVRKKASDIHMEPEEEDLRIRFRVDGVLRDIIKMPRELQPAIVSRVKILSKLKIDEQRVPQDGRFDAITNEHEIDLRVSTLPTIRGEKIALRILDKTQSINSFEELGIEGNNLKTLESNITKPFGIILATGPTGSGKSTTLYSILQKISNPSINVVTLEDPVEYEIPGINQCQVKPKIGFSFADGLRSVLRQDPNIIMVGEIRDSETAGMATHAALTGHLVLSTLHTNDAAGALPRLINMGIEPFLITSSINVIIAQRLVRKICDKCKRVVKIPEQINMEVEKELEKFNLPKPYKFYEGAGCSQCNQGFSGRVGIYEILAMTDKIEEAALKKRPASEIQVVAIDEGMITLKQDGLIKAIKGLTTVSEVLRTTTTER